MSNDTIQTDDKTVNGYSILVAAIAGLTWGASFISRNVWSSAIASDSTLTSLGITALQAGGIATAFYVGYVASNFFSGWVIDSLGAKKSLAITALGTGLATVAIPLTSGYWAMFILRVLAGIFAGPLFSCIIKFNLAYFPDKYRAVVQGFIGAGSALGSAIASIWFTPMIAEKGYKVAFVWAGIITFVIGVIVLLIIKDRGVTMPIKQMDMLSEEEKQHATKAALKIFMQKDFLIGCVNHLLVLASGTGMTTWMLKYLINEKHMDAGTAGLVFGSSLLVGIFTGTVSGILSDALKTRKWLMVVCAPLSFILLMMFKVVNGVGALTVLFIVFKFVSAFVSGPSNVMQIERAKGPYSGKVQGWYNAIAQLGSVIMPVLLGFILDKTGSYSSVITGIGSVYLGIMVLGLLVKDTYNKSI